jgi:hypothetical protein
VELALPSGVDGRGSTLALKLVNAALPRLGSPPAPLTLAGGRLLLSCCRLRVRHGAAGKAMPV